MNDIKQEAAFRHGFCDGYFNGVESNTYQTKMNAMLYQVGFDEGKKLANQENKQTNNLSTEQDKI